MSAEPFDDQPEEVVLSPLEAAQVASLDAVAVDLQADARSWARQLGELSALAARADKDGPQTRRTLALDLAGSWKVSQLTAERWVGEAERFYDGLPIALSMLQAGALLRHQAVVLLHRRVQPGRRAGCGGRGPAGRCGPVPVRPDPPGRPGAAADRVRAERSGRR